MSGGSQDSVGHIMTPHPVTVAAEASAVEAMVLMEQVGCRHLPVVSGGHLVGLVSMKDVRCECSHQRIVRDLMTTELITAEPDDSIERAAATMALAKVDCLPVIEEGRLVGILTTYDVLDLLCRRFRATEAE